MTLLTGTYFFKTLVAGKHVFILVLDGRRVGEVSTRKEATKWYAAAIKA